MLRIIIKKITTSHICVLFNVEYLFRLYQTIAMIVKLYITDIGVDLRKKINWPGGPVKILTTGPFKIPLAREISVHEVDRYKRGDLLPPPPPPKRQETKDRAI